MEREITREEILRLRAETTSKAHEQRSQMASLITNAAFLALRAVMKEQIEQRLNAVLVMPTGQDDLLQKTYAMGEMAGIKLAMDMPDVLIEYAKESIESVVRSEQNEKDMSDGENSDDGGTGYRFTDTGE